MSLASEVRAAAAFVSIIIGTVLIMVGVMLVGVSALVWLLVTVGPVVVMFLQWFFGLGAFTSGVVITALGLFFGLAAPRLLYNGE